MARCSARVSVRAGSRRRRQLASTLPRSRISQRSPVHSANQPQYPLPMRELSSPNRDNYNTYELAYWFLDCVKTTLGEDFQDFLRALIRVLNDFRRSDRKVEDTHDVIRRVEELLQLRGDPLLIAHFNEFLTAPSSDLED